SPSRTWPSRTTESELQNYSQSKGLLQEQIQRMDLEIENLKQQRKQTPHHIPVQSLPEKDRFTRLRTERKHFVDTIKMIAYRAETSLASLLREHLVRSDDARALLRQILQNEVIHSPFAERAMPPISTFRVDRSMKNRTTNRVRPELVHTTVKKSLATI